jgi:hypothetical protein
MKQAVLDLLKEIKYNEKDPVFWSANKLLTQLIRSEEDKKTLKEVIEKRVLMLPFWDKIPNTLFREAIRKETLLPYFDLNGIDSRIHVFAKNTFPSAAEVCFQWKEDGVSEYDFLFLVSTIQWRYEGNVVPQTLAKVYALANKYCFTGGTRINAPWTKVFYAPVSYLDELIAEFYIIRENHNRELVAELCNLINDGLLVKKRAGTDFYGLFCHLTDIHVGLIPVTYYGGTLLNEDTNMKHKTFQQIQKRGSCYFISVNADENTPWNAPHWYIDSLVFWKLKEKGRFMNHASENGNAYISGVQGQELDDIIRNSGRISLPVILQRDVERGEELVFNYTSGYNSACMENVEGWQMTDENKDHYVERYTEVFE